MKEINLNLVLSEKRAFEEFQEGNMTRFNYFFDKYYQGLCLYAHHLLKSESDAEDLVQDFFVRLIENKKKITILTSVKAYFLRSVHNRCLDFIAHQEVVKSYENQIIMSFRESDFQEYPLIDSELRTRIENAIQSLPDGIRETFIAHRFEGLAYRELADRQDISVKTVEYRISKALSILRKDLGEYLFLLLILL